MSTVSLFGVSYAVTDYEQASQVIVDHAQRRASYGVSALAVHGLMTAQTQPDFRQQLNQIPLVVPDGQPVRWAMNSFYRVQLKDRVYGPTLTLKVLEKAQPHALSIFLYGSTPETLKKFSSFIQTTFPQLTIAGTHADRFREATPEEDQADIEKINASGAHLILVGRGCPRQEIWVAQHMGKIHGAMMAVGAAFDFHAGSLRQAPKWMQDAGLEWFFRLLMEPRRLFKRYLTTNSRFIYMFLKQKLLGNPK